jgi:hypothetical protein
MLVVVCSTHSCWGALAPRNFTQEVILLPTHKLTHEGLSGVYSQYL